MTLGPIVYYFPLSHNIIGGIKPPSQTQKSKVHIQFRVRARERRVFTGVDAILRAARLDEDFEVDETQRHESQGESSHETRKPHQSHDYHHIYEELGSTACHVCCHLSLFLSFCLFSLQFPGFDRSHIRLCSSNIFTEFVLRVFAHTQPHANPVLRGPPHRSSIVRWEAVPVASLKME